MAVVWTIPRARPTDRTFKTWSIVCLGHSFWARFTYGLLAAQATARYLRGAGAAHRDVPTWLMKGISGELIAGYTARVGTDVTPFAPAAVLVSGPENDFGAGRTTIQLTADYQALIAALVSAGVPVAKIGLVNLLAHNNTFPEADIAAINAYNTTIQAVADAAGCATVDVRGPYAASRAAGGPPWTDDGLHPTQGSGPGYTNPNGDLKYSNAMAASVQYA